MFGKRRCNRQKCDNRCALSGDGILLTNVKQDTEVILSQLCNKKNLRRKLQEMGLTEGVRFKVINSTKNGPVVVSVRGSKLALGYGMSEQILVTEIG